MSYFAGIAKVVDHCKSGRSTSALGQKRTLQLVHLMSALPPKADIAERDRHVRFWRVRYRLLTAPRSHHGDAPKQRL
jgi:hypothetical protein